MYRWTNYMKKASKVGSPARNFPGYALLGKKDMDVPTSTQGVFSITWEFLKCGKQDEACEKQRRSVQWPKRMQT